jgi:two-component system, cell cycle sensor histidine kinase and response regulator CckA
MPDSVFVLLINNAALLMTLAYAYSQIRVYEKEQSPWWMKAFLGLVVGAIGLSIMLLSYEPEPGIKFDSRSILLAGSGLYLGPVPTLLAMALTGAFAWLQGGPGAPAGTAIILASGLIGILWRGWRREHRLADLSWVELYLFGLTVHAAILNLFYLLPFDEALNALEKTWVPVILLYPVLTMFFGRMMAVRLQRERTDRLVRESEERHRAMFENNHAVMLLVDPADDTIIDANHKAAAFYGYDRDELRGRRVGDLLAPAETAVGDASPSSSLPARPGEAVVARHKIKGGQVRDVEVYSDAIALDGRSLQYHIVHDITEQKRLEDQLRQAQKMEAVGWLAGGIAHDYNNKLQAVLGFAEMAEKEAVGRPRLRGYLGEIRKAARHSAQLTSQLMAFARKQTLLPEVLNMNTTIAHMLKMIKNMLGEDIDLEWRPGHELWNVLTDASQFDRILVNLALNARDAMPDVGRIIIETRNVEVDDQLAASIPEASPGEFVMVSISDTGAGMSRDQLRHIFEPFYTTKEVGRGTGLGLASVYGVVKQNKGFINVKSELGVGTTFEIFFPRTHEKLPEPVFDPSAGRAERGQETILLVEDEKLVLELIQETLRDAGYTVLAAGEPREALRMAEAHDGKIDLLVTDVVMPGMNGRVLYDTLSEVRPGLKVLYMSGYTANANISRGVLDSDINYMQKPFSIGTIASKIREVLDGTKSRRTLVAEDADA